MKLMNKISLTIASATLCLVTLQAPAQEAQEGEQQQGAAQQQQQQQQAPQRQPYETAGSLDELLERVEQATLTETEEQRQREQRFEQNVAERESMLNEMQARRDELEAISADLENQYNENEVIKSQRFETLQERLGDLQELFGTIAGIVGDTRSSFEGSLISAQYPGRDEFLRELSAVLADESDLPSTEELERLWFYMLQEITESGKVVEFESAVTQPDGTQSNQEVVRIGTYNIVSDGNYLRFEPGTERLTVLARQPDSEYQEAALALQNSTSGYTKVGIDPTGPTGGSYLAALISYPTLGERIEQGREIGQIILALGAVALLFALERMFTLTLVGAKVNKQLKNTDQPKSNNPLGRVLMVYENDRSMDIETLELKLGEAILKETPKLERFLTLLKIIATVAPLLGLLGTVTGMITVFQAITLFGTGDPQVMAGGISGALVTTVLGLVVAIPTVLLHTLVKSRSDRIIHILEEQATGIIARKAESSGSHA